jgi:hypothetical protein
VPAAFTAEDDNDSPWKPTKLGLEMIELLPEYAEATWYSCNVRTDDADEPEIMGWEDATFALIKERMIAATNLVDLAIAYRIRRDAETPDKLFRTAKRLAEWFGEEAPATEEETSDGRGEWC